MLKLLLEIKIFNTLPEDVPFCLIHISTRHDARYSPFIYIYIYNCYYSYLQPCIQAILVPAIHVSLPQHHQLRLEAVTRSYVLQTVHNFIRIFPGLLMAELVTRNAEDRQSATLPFRPTSTVFLEQLIQADILIGILAKRSHVHGQDDLVSESP